MLLWAFLALAVSTHASGRHVCATYPTCGKLCVGVAALRGYRRSMEDSFAVLAGTERLSLHTTGHAPQTPTDWALLGVYDGHGGKVWSRGCRVEHACEGRTCRRRRRRPLPKSISCRRCKSSCRRNRTTHR